MMYYTISITKTEESRSLCSREMMVWEYYKTTATADPTSFLSNLV